MCQKALIWRRKYTSVAAAGERTRLCAAIGHGAVVVLHVQGAYVAASIFYVVARGVAWEGSGCRSRPEAFALYELALVAEPLAAAGE